MPEFAPRHGAKLTAPDVFPRLPDLLWLDRRTGSFDGRTMRSAEDHLPPTGISLLRKILAGSATRVSRFHDELGGVISAGRLIRNAPRAVFSGLARILFNKRPQVPWISYDAQADVARALSPQSRVLEFGSGMSTMWYAGRAKRVVSIEDHQGWFDLIARQVRALSNVDYRFAKSREAYVAAATDEQFDLIVIDGSYRDDCARFAIEHLNGGGVIYLDNCDMGIDPLTGDVPEARRILTSFAARNGLPTREYTDFAPTQFHVQRGLWVGPLPS